MKTKTEGKERIIAATMEIINENEGKTAQITTRLIAEKVDVGIGLINYHFRQKKT